MKVGSTTTVLVGIRVEVATAGWDSGVLVNCGDAVGVQVGGRPGVGVSVAVGITMVGASAGPAGRKGLKALAGLIMIIPTMPIKHKTPSSVIPVRMSQIEVFIWLVPG